MTTRLKKSVSRVVETPSLTLVVTLTAEGLVMREKFARQSYLLPYGLGYLKAIHLAGKLQEATPKARRPRRVRRNLLQGAR